MIIARYQFAHCRVVVHDCGIEVFKLKPEAKHCEDFDFDNPFEVWDTYLDHYEIHEEKEDSE